MNLTYVVAIQLLLLVELRTLLVDTGAVVDGVTAEGDVEVLQESVAASEKRLGLIGVSIDTWLAVKDNDTVGKVSGHDEVVLDNESGSLGVHDETLDNSGSNDALLGVEVGGRLVNEVDIRWHAKGKDNCNTLQFTTGQVLDFLVNEIIQLERLDNISLELR